MDKGLLHVSLEQEARVEEARAVEAVFHRAGIEAHAKPGIIGLSVAEHPYLVVIGAPIAWLGAKFAGGIVNAAATDTWEAFRNGGWRGVEQLVSEIRHARGADRPGDVEIHQPSGPRITLSVDLPQEAFRQLAELDWSQLTGGMLGWRDGDGCWVHVARGALEPEPAPRSPFRRKT